MARLEAVLWDMDGVIADTGIYHFQAWQQVFGKRGVTFTEEDFRSHFGQRNDTIVRDAFHGRIAPAEVDVVAEEKEEDYRRRVSASVKPLPGAIELLRALSRRGIKMAIASSAPLENIRLIIGALGVEDCFQAIVFGREVSEGKPDPQVFLLAARKLDMVPEDCLVIEDAVAGVAAAKRAGMRCLAVTNSHPKESLRAADLVVASLAEVTVADLERLFERPEA